MDQPSRRAMPWWPSALVLFAAGAYLTLRWDAIPARWIIHWGPSGQPNGWATRSVPGVYGLLGLGAVILAMSELTTPLRWSRGRNLSPEVRAATIQFMRLCIFGTSLALAFLAVNLPLGPSMSIGARLALALGPLALCMIAGTVQLISAQREARASGQIGSSEGYRGPFYSNRNDQRLWVPKLSGMGWTINFAHPLGWPVFLLILGVPIGLAIASAALR